MRIIYMLGWYSQAWGRGTVLRIVSLGGSQVLIIGLLWHTDTHARRHVETHTYMHGPHSKRVHTGLDHWNKKKNNIFFSFFVAVELYSVCPLHDITPPKTMSSCLTNQELRTRVCPFFFLWKWGVQMPEGPLCNIILINIVLSGKIWDTVLVKLQRGWWETEAPLQA